MRTALDAAEQFVDWRQQRSRERPQITSQDFGTQLLLWLEDEGIDFVAARYDTFLQTVLVLLTLEYGELPQVGESSKDCLQQDPWFDTLSEDTFRRVSYRFHHRSDSGR